MGSHFPNILSLHFHLTCTQLATPSQFFPSGYAWAYTDASSWSPRPEPSSLKQFVHRGSQSDERPGDLPFCTLRRMIYQCAPLRNASLYIAPRMKLKLLLFSSWSIFMIAVPQDRGTVPDVLAAVIFTCDFREGSGGTLGWGKITGKKSQFTGPFILHLMLAQSLCL